MVLALAASQWEVKLLSCVWHFVIPWTVQFTRLPHPWNSPGKGTGVGCHFLLQGIFLTQGLNLTFPLCRQTLYSLRHQGRPKWEIDHLKHRNTGNQKAAFDTPATVMYIQNLYLQIPTYWGKLYERVSQSKIAELGFFWYSKIDIVVNIFINRKSWLSD